MPTNRRHRTRTATLAPALAEWTKTEEADKFFSRDYEYEDLHYGGPEGLRALLKPPLSACPTYTIWCDHVDGNEDPFPEHVRDGRCRKVLATLLELHEIWKRSKR